MRAEGREQGDPDDWFAGPKRLPDEWSSPSRADEAAPAGAGELEDWLYEWPQSPERSARARGARRLALAAALLGLCLLIGLAAAGLFSGHSHRASAPAAPAAPASGLTVSSPPAPFTPPTPRTPATPLKLGAHGAAVIALQRALARLGYYSGRIDGQYGPGTADAVSRFQTASGLAPDGIAGPRTLRALKR